MIRQIAVTAIVFVLALAGAGPGPAPASAPGREQNVKRLNNLVTELLAASADDAQAQRHTFTNPRDGWVFIASEANVSGPGGVRISLDGGVASDLVIAHESKERGAVEAMRLLPAGEHELRVRCDRGATLQSLTVRAIPELLYCKFQANPHVAEYGPYDWDFLGKYVLPHVNTIVGSGDESHRPYVEQWKRRGGRWIVECGVPGLAKGTSATADEAERYWSENVGMQDPLLDGVIADEFPGDDRKQYAAWTEAIRRIQRNPQFEGKVFYPYCGTMYDAEASREFVQTAMDAGWRFAWEGYLPEQPTEAEARAYLAEGLSEVARGWREIQPEAVKHMIVCFGYLSAPPESVNINPGVNYKVWMDMQFNLLANDPAFEGLYGVMEYLSAYSDEENVRWAARLYRHYCIEGNTGPLTSDPYILPHLENPDFGRDLERWEVAPAEPGSIAARSMEGYSWLEGRYPKTSQGDAFLWMKRSARRPNVVSQTIRDLQPGRLYSLKMYTGDYRDLSLQQKHAVSIQLDGAEVLSDRSFQHVFHNCYSHHLGEFDDQNHAWMNYHWRVFRPKGEEARITISDWAARDDAGGPIGQELMFNFVEVQPYLAD